jgi:large subunit ribosomal protein L25
MTTTTINVQTRSLLGTGGARATRREGFIPGILYGNDQPAVALAIDPKALQKEMHKVGFFSKIFDITLDNVAQKVIARDVQLHPVTDQIVHVDFMRVSKDRKIHVTVPVIFTHEDKAPGLKKGGTLNILRHELELLCDFDKIPTNITISLEGFEINQSIHLEQVQLPEGVKPVLHGQESTLATILAPNTATEETSEKTA